MLFYRLYFYAQNNMEQTKLEKPFYKIKTTSSVIPLPEVIKHGPREKHEIALTFDADMTLGMQELLKSGAVKSWFDKGIIDTLTQENVKATIFMTGLWAESYPKEAKEIAENPLFEIESHSYSHLAFTKNCYNLPYATGKSKDTEIEKANEIIQKITGIKPRYFRFPGGCHKKEDVKEVEKYGLKIIQWDTVSGDAFSYNINQIINNVETKAENGSIIVFHLNGAPNAPETNNALIKAIPYLKNKGFKFVKISELLSQS